MTWAVLELARCSSAVSPGLLVWLFGCLDGRSFLRISRIAYYHHDLDDNLRHFRNLSCSHSLSNNLRDKAGSRGGLPEFVIVKLYCRLDGIDRPKILFEDRRIGRYLCAVSHRGKIGNCALSQCLYRVIACWACLAIQATEYSRRTILSRRNLETGACI